MDARAATRHVKGGIAMMENATRQVSEETNRRETHPTEPVGDGGAGRDLVIGFGGLGLCVLAALIVTLLS
jgi:hypothetical protein